jgi:RHS repeat-associated protein
MNPHWHVGDWGYYTGVASARQYARARHYDPRLGRFLSRDTVPSRVGSKDYVYVANNPAAHLDPSGNVKISLMSATAGTCGGWIARFLMRLNRPAGRLGGFMVQKITIEEDWGQCRKPKKKRSYFYFEAFFVRPGSTMFYKEEDAPRRRGGTDASTENDRPDHRGTVSASGQVKYFSAETLAAAGVRPVGDLSQDPNWVDPETGRGRARDEPSLPSTEKEPGWWKQGGDDPPTASRRVKSNWCCCPPKRWSEVVITIDGKVARRMGRAQQTCSVDDVCDDCCLA